MNIALTGTEVLRCGVVLLVGFLFAFTAGRQGSRTGLWLAAGLVFTDLLVEAGPPAALVLTAVTGAFWGIGRIVRSRAQLAQALHARNAELRLARDERARLEVAADRMRLSRELEDLLHRRLVALARIAESAPTDDPAESRAAFAEIERESRDTLEGMRAAVKGLRAEDREPGLRPQPTLTHLDALLVQAKGAEARLTVEGDPRVLPPSVELAAYRIVEQLLSALDDAPGVEVHVDFRDEALELAVSGPARRRAKASPGTRARACATAGRLVRGHGVRRPGASGRVPARARGGVR